MIITLTSFLNNLINSPSLIVITLLISVAMFMNGLNDAPNSIATCVGTRCLSPKKALVLASIFDFLGVILMTFITTEVVETMFNIAGFDSSAQYNLVALASALTATLLWSAITYMLKVPSSQSHALIAGISGAAIALKGDFSAVDLSQLKKVLYGLIIINLLSFVLGFVITKIIEKICREKDRRKTNKFFRKFQIVGAASMSFMHGAQDGQKFMGIFLLGIGISKGVTNLSDFSVPLWLMIYTSLLITLGITLGGMRIIKTVGTKVVKLEKYQGAAADMSSSISLIISSVLGIPASTSHSKSCAVMGVGASKRLSNVNWKIAQNMVLTWLITFPGCGVLGFVLTKIFINIFV